MTAPEPLEYLANLPESLLVELNQIVRLSANMNDAEKLSAGALLFGVANGLAAPAEVDDATLMAARMVAGLSLLIAHVADAAQPAEVGV